MSLPKILFLIEMKQIKDKIFDEYTCYINECLNLSSRKISCCVFIFTA